MKIIAVETLIANGDFATSDEWREARNGLHEAVKAVVWPIGSNRFTIYPESGKLTTSNPRPSQATSSDVSPK